MVCQLTPGSVSWPPPGRRWVVVGGGFAVVEEIGEDRDEVAAAVSASVPVGRGRAGSMSPQSPSVKTHSNWWIEGKPNYQHQKTLGLQLKLMNQELN